METTHKNEKKLTASYYALETRDLHPGTLECNYWDWDEIDRRDNLGAARTEYEKQLTTHDTLRLVQVTFTTVAQSYKTPRYISDLESNLNEVENNIRKHIIEFLKSVDLHDYPCNICLAGGYVVTELVLDYDRELVEVIFTDPSGSSKFGELSDFSAEEQLTILKAILK